MKKKIYPSMIFLLCLIMVLTACGSSGGKTASQKSDAGSGSSAVKISVMCVGDIMAHSPNIGSAQKADGSYDFNDNYEYVKKYIKRADLALCNMETTFGGGTPQGYPMFNAPDALADAVKNAGFDVAITSNNHMMDTGYDGMQRTIKVLRAAGLDTVGSRYEGEKGYIVEKVKGVKVGIVAYTYETTGSAGGTVTINGNAIPDKAAKLINSFNYHELDSSDYGKIQDDIDGCRDDGADVVVCYMHWGEEYQQEPNDNQKKMARKLADMGADVIFASHPHVLQKTELLDSPSGGKVPVFYSLGNFISNQRTETLQNKYTEDGAMAYVTLTVLPDKEKIQAESVKIVPTWVDKYQYKGKNEYRIIPLDGDLSTNKTLALSGHFGRADDARQYEEKLFDGYIKGRSIFTAGGESDDSSAAA